MPEKQQRRSRVPIALLETALAVAAVALLWWRPFEESLSVVLASVFAVIFLGLLPALFQGAGTAKKENALLKRGFSEDSDRKGRF